MKKIVGLKKKTLEIIFMGSLMPALSITIKITPLNFFLLNIGGEMEFNKPVYVYSFYIINLRLSRIHLWYTHET